MSERNIDPNETSPAGEPTLRERTRPGELLALAGGLALFVGLITFMAVHDAVLALIFGGLSFIVALVGLAMLALAFGPDAADISGMKRLDEERHDSEPTPHDGQQR